MRDDHSTNGRRGSPSGCVVAALCRHAAAPRSQPPTDLEAQSRALERASQAVVGVQVLALEDARSERHAGPVAPGLGRGHRPRRAGADDRLPGARGRPGSTGARRRTRVPARVVGYDLATGFGLLQPLAPLRITPAPLGGSHGGLDRRVAAGRQRRRERPAQHGAPGVAAQLCRLLGIPHRRRLVHGTAAHRPQRCRAVQQPRRAGGHRLADGGRHTRWIAATAHACLATCSCRPTCCSRSWPSCARAACPAPAAAPGWA